MFIVNVLGKDLKAQPLLHVTNRCGMSFCTFTG